MNPKIESALRRLPLALLAALGICLWKIKNTLAAALVRRDEAIEEAAGLRGAIAQAKQAAVELQGEVDRSRRERDAEAHERRMIGKEALGQRGRADAAEAQIAELAKACARALDIIEAMDGYDTITLSVVTELQRLVGGGDDAGRYAHLSARGPAEQTRIDVVSAVIVRGGKLLLAQRLPTADFPELWECPGGKVEPGETFPGALIREVREELGVEVLSISTFKRVSSGPPVTKDYLAISFYRVDIGDQTPLPLAAMALLWATREEVLNLPMLPGNCALRPELVALCGPAPTIKAASCAGCGVALCGSDDLVIAANGDGTGEKRRVCDECAPADTDEEHALRHKAFGAPSKRLPPDAVRKAGAEVEPGSEGT